MARRRQQTTEQRPTATIDGRRPSDWRMTVTRIPAPALATRCALMALRIWRRRPPAGGPRRPGGSRTTAGPSRRRERRGSSWSCGKATGGRRGRQASGATPRPRSGNADASTRGGRWRRMGARETTDSELCLLGYLYVIVTEVGAPLRTQLADTEPDPVPMSRFPARAKFPKDVVKKVECFAPPDPAKSSLTNPGPPRLRT